MRMRRRCRRLLLATAFLLVPALGACGGADVEDDVDIPAASEATGDEAVRVTEVDLGRSIGADGRISDADEADDFRPGDTIYAVVETDGAASGTTLTARWTFEDGQVVDETSQTLSPSGAAVTEFNISHPDGFPPGNYRVEILLNGRSVETKDFEVR